jgi:PERQ amino acid-rich with GYF domain-containing protein
VPEQPSLTIPRKLSVSSLSGGLNSPREGGLPSPRNRGGLTPGGFDGVLSSGGESWHSRRRVSDATKPSGLGLGRVGDEGGGEGLGIKEEPDEDLKSPDAKVGDKPATDQTQAAVQAQPLEPPGSVGQNLAQGIGQLSLKGDASSGAGYPLAKNIVNPTPVDLAAVEWSYIDPQGVQQGTSAMMNIIPVVSTRSWSRSIPRGHHAELARSGFLYAGSAHETHGA